MSADVHDKFVLKEEQTLFRYCDGNLSFSTNSHEDDYNYNKKKMSRVGGVDMVTHSVTMLEKHSVFPGETPPRDFTTNRVKKRSMKPEDPMSHRIIEKRRRDRMNNCLADLSRLIPPEYLKKGRGRIEKTEIIEMAIKHMRHLQNVIASTRFNGNLDGSVPSPPATSRDATALPGDQPIVVEHFRLGYLECLSEAIHFLVEVQGYFAGDSLCVQMINHLHKHCDKMLKGHTIKFSRKNTGETTSSDSSTSPPNGTYNNSPTLGLSNSTGSASDDNQPNFESGIGRQYEKRYPDSCYSSNTPKRTPEGRYSRYPDADGPENESESHHQNFVLKCRNSDSRKEDSNKSYFNNFETGPNFGHRNHPVTNGICSNLDDSNGCENFSTKEEIVNGPSQLREMLTSPISIGGGQVNRHSTRSTGETKGNTSPMSNLSGCEVKSSSLPNPSKNFKSQIESGENHSDLSESLNSENHHMMYKFKNNIKQRFSKEKRENFESEVNGNAHNHRPSKRQKSNEDFQKYPDPLMKERLNLLDRTEPEEEKGFKFNADFEGRKRNRYGSESEIHHDGGDISNRLSFGHKSNERGKQWEDSNFQYQNSSKLWHLSPNASFITSQMNGAKSQGKAPGLLTEYSRIINNNSFNNISDSSPTVPIFALHAKGSFYIPLTLDHAALAPFLTILGITKADEVIEEKTVLHPVTISVNFQSHLVR